MLGTEVLVRAVVRLHEVLVGCFCFTPVLALQLAGGVFHNFAFPDEPDHACVITVAVVVAFIRATSIDKGRRASNAGAVSFVGRVPVHVASDHKIITPIRGVIALTGFAPRPVALIVPTPSIRVLTIGAPGSVCYSDAADRVCFVGSENRATIVPKPIDAVVEIGPPRVVNV